MLYDDFGTIRIEAISVGLIVHAFFILRKKTVSGNFIQ